MAKKTTQEAPSTPKEAATVTETAPEDLQGPITTPVESSITQAEINTAEPMMPAPQVDTEVRDITDVPREVRLALLKATDDLCGEVQIRRFEEKKLTVEMDIMMKGLSARFGQLRGGRKLVTGIEIPKDFKTIVVSDLADDIRMLSRL